MRAFLPASRTFLAKPGELGGLRRHIHRTGLPSFEDVLKVRPDFCVNVTDTRINTAKLTLIVSLHCVNNGIHFAKISPPLPLNFPKLLYFLRNPFKHPRPLPVTLGQLTDDTINFLFIPHIILNGTIFTKNLQHPNRKRYRRVAQPMRRNVGGRYAGASDFRSAVTTPVIPNELPKSVGQLANETIIGTTSTQSLPNLLNMLRTDTRTSNFNWFKKMLNLLGEGCDGIRTILTTRSLPVLPGHPQDPVYGLLQVGGAVRQRRVLVSLLVTTLGENIVTATRQKGAHKCAKAAEVKAVGATAQGGETRVAEERGRAGAGGHYGVEEISDVVVTKEVE
ncbi:thiamine-monophosphate kinase [Babesia caballi]|uniref:Thiamine-monophosphate kinase n=1 Tax=Babesia caballi TaxID=5871 RepID=A0AAV4LT10_BABCB|nr:thiamine-monophosphate kinase [Babesia caballi]